MDKSLALFNRMLVLDWICLCRRGMGLRARPLIRTCMDGWAVHRIAVNSVVYPMGQIASNSNAVEIVVDKF